MAPRFSDDTKVVPAGDGVFSAELASHWWVIRGPHGGYLAALVLRAMSQHLGGEARPPRSLTIHFTAPPKEGEVRISCEITRAGRRMTFMSARVEQQDRLIALALGTFAPSAPGLSFEDAPMPEAGEPGSGLAVAESPEAPPFVRNFDMRWRFGDRPFSGSEEAKLGGWIRFATPELADPPAIAAFMDAWAPAVFPVAKEIYVCPTVDLTIHFRSEFPLGGAGADDYFLGRFTCHVARDGFFEEDGELWSADGTLVAQSRQLALAIPLSQT